MTKTRTPSHPLVQFLHDRRRRRGLTREQVAARAGCSVRAIEYWEWGMRSPSVESLIEYAGALGYEVTLTAKGGPR